MKVKALFFVQNLNLPGVANNTKTLNIVPGAQGSITNAAKHCIRADGGFYVYFPAAINKGWHFIPDSFVQSARCEPGDLVLMSGGLMLDEKGNTVPLEVPTIQEAGIKSEAALEYEAEQAAKTSGAPKTKKSTKPARA